jgi:Ca2+-binding RTX toxin-like protein
MRKRGGMNSGAGYVIEPIEPRLLLSIVWINRGSDNFGIYGANTTAARQDVDRAIAAWNAVILNFNYQGRANEFDLTIQAANIDGSHGVSLDTLAVTQQFGADFDLQFKPHHALISVDNNGAGFNWLFDTNTDNRLFPTPINSYASFGTQTDADFYTTIAHEIGHAMGINALPFAQITGDLVDSGVIDPTDPNNGHLFTLAGHGNTYTFNDSSGLHLYGGPAVGGLATFPDDLMTPTQFTGERKQISAADVDVLQAVYGYTVAAPPVLSTLFANVTSGTLSVNGSIAGDNISITNDGAGNYVVNADGQLNQSFPIASVQNISAQVYGGNNSIVVSNFVNANATLIGGSGNDTLVGGAGNDFITDTAGNNLLEGGPGNDTIIGGSGNDYIIGGGGNDSLKGQHGKSGAGGNDTLWGGWGDDTLVAGNGDDLLTGRAGNDWIYANNHFADTIYGGLGNNTATVDPGNIDLIPNNDIQTVIVGT